MDEPYADLIVLDSKTAPRWVGVHAGRIIAARGSRARMMRVFDQSALPMMLVKRDRRFVDANRAARLAVRRTLDECRQLRIDDLAAPEFRPVIEKAWTRLNETACVAGISDVAFPAGTSMRIVYYAMANALPGLHLVVFVPAGWPEDELLSDVELQDLEPAAALTPRELQVLELAAEGLSGPMIANELALSVGTVRTHFEHIYDKLGARDRAAAVAKAMRLGLIT